jgi:coproporphyrinogen III oxidase-like Fe-S oxidoreductase
MGTPMTHCCYPRYSKETMPMSEPTQEFIVSELRRRVRVSMADLTQALGLQFASVLPQEIQRMKASGLVVYEEPLGLYSVLSLPQ